MKPSFSTIHVLVNRKSGTSWSFDRLEQAIAEHWDSGQTEVTYAFTHSKADGIAKARRARDAGIDLLAVAGGDGTVSTIAAELLGSRTCLAAIPIGSGNGFCRHFGIPLDLPNAIAALANGRVRTMDVGRANGQPFLVTCSMAWDAALVEEFNRSPFRGFLPYFVAGVVQYFEYKRQPMKATLDSGESFDLKAPVMFTIANLSQYGGGAILTNDACPEDGQLELIVARQKDVPAILSGIGMLIKGSISDLPKMIYRQFKEIHVERRDATPIQLDGELVESPRDVTVRVEPSALHVLTPFAVRYGGPGLGMLMPLSAIPFLFCYLTMILWPVPDLVFGAPKPDERPSD